MSNSNVIEIEGAVVEMDRSGEGMRGRCAEMATSRPTLSQRSRARSSTAGRMSATTTSPAMGSTTAGRSLPLKSLRRQAKPRKGSGVRSSQAHRVDAVATWRDHAIPKSLRAPRSHRARLARSSSGATGADRVDPGEIPDESDPPSYEWVYRALLRDTPVPRQNWSASTGSSRSRPTGCPSSIWSASRPIAKIIRKNQLALRGEERHKASRAWRLFRARTSADGSTDI